MNKTLSRVQRREVACGANKYVVWFATGFETSRGGGQVSTGPFEVLVDADGIEVRYAALCTESEFEAMQEALIRARAAHLAMAGGWGAQAEGRTPTLLDAATLALAELEAVQTADGEAPSTARAIEALRAAVAANGGGA